MIIKKFPLAELGIAKTTLAKTNLAQKTGYEESQKIASGNKVSGAGLGIQTPAQCPLKSMPSDLQHPANAAVSFKLESY